MKPTALEYYRPETVDELYADATFKREVAAE